MHDLDDVLLDVSIHDDVLAHGLKVKEFADSDHRLELLDHIRLPEPVKDDVIIFLAGISQRHLEEKAVHLGLGQRESALQLNRVLRGQHHERTWQGTRVCLRP